MTLPPLTAEERTQHERMRDMPDDGIDLSDMPELPDSFFDRADRRSVPLEVDADVAGWFERRGNARERMNEVLRRHVEAEAKRDDAG